MQPFQTVGSKGRWPFRTHGPLRRGQAGLERILLRAYAERIFRKAVSLRAHIRAGDVFLFHPYDSFTPVLDFIRRSSEDPGVIAIKQTLYRVGNASPIVKALIRPALRQAGHCRGRAESPFR